MKRNLLKCILWALLLAGCFPLLAVAGAQQKEQRYKIAVCDWMILKRQKIGSFQLVHELKGDGVELDMGGLGKRGKRRGSAAQHTAVFLPNSIVADELRQVAAGVEQQRDCQQNL